MNRLLRNLADLKSDMVKVSELFSCRNHVCLYPSLIGFISTVDVDTKKGDSCCLPGNQANICREQRSTDDGGRP